MVFGIVLNRNGWRIDYLGTNTPVEELTRTLDARRPDLVVLAATLPENLEPHATQLTVLAQRAPLALAGAGATPQIAAAWGPGCSPATQSPKPGIFSGRSERARGRRLRLGGHQAVPRYRNLPRRGRDNTPSRLLPRRQ
jgi:hypothetical protein